MHQLPSILSCAVGIQHHHRLDDPYPTDAICVETTDLARTEVWHKLYLLYWDIVCITLQRPCRLSLPIISLILASIFRMALQVKYIDSADFSCTARPH